MELQTTKKYDLDRVVKLIITIVTIGLGVWLLNYLSPVLIPFLVGFILAYLIEPIVEWLMRVLHIRARWLGVLLALVIVIGGITGLCWLLIPYLTSEVATMSKQLAAYAKTEFKVPYVPAEVNEWIQKYLNTQEISEIFSKDQWFSIVNKTLSGAWSFLGGTMSVVMSIVSSLIVLLYMFFILLDFDKLTRSFKGAIPGKYRKTSLRIFNDVAGTMSRYFRGQAVVSFFVGIIFAIEFYIIGLPMAIAFGLFVGVLNMVPYLQLVSIPIAAFLCLVATVVSGGSFWMMFLWVIIAYLICQAIQDMVLIPIIMKQQMGLNPAIVFLSLSLWAYVLGFIGLVIGLPLTTLIISYYCEYVLHRPNPLHPGQPKKRSDSKAPLMLGIAQLKHYTNQQKENNS